MGATKDNTTWYIQKLIRNESRGGGSGEAMLQSEVEGGLCSSRSYKAPVCVSRELL